MLVEGVAFKKCFSYAGFEQQPKKILKPKILLLNLELELKAEKDNAELKIESPSVYIYLFTMSFSFLWCCDDSAGTRPGNGPDLPFPSSRN